MSKGILIGQLAAASLMVIMIGAAGCANRYGAGGSFTIGEELPATPVPTAVPPVAPIIIQQRDAGAEMAAYQAGRTQGETAGQGVGLLGGIALFLAAFGFAAVGLIVSLLRSRNRAAAETAPTYQPQPQPTYFVSPPAWVPPTMVSPQPYQQQLAGGVALSTVARPVRTFYAVLPSGNECSIPADQARHLDQFANRVESALAAIGCRLPVVGGRAKMGVIEFFVDPAGIDPGVVWRHESTLAQQLGASVRVGTAGAQIIVAVFAAEVPR